MGKLGTILKTIGMGLFLLLGLLFLAVSLPMTGWQAMSVQTGSMEPSIQPGHLVVVQRATADKLQAGDVITYSTKAHPEPITHRLIEKQNPGQGSPQKLITKGDANPTPDAPVDQSQVIGKVVATIPFLGRAFDFLKTPLGLAIFIYIPALLLIIYELKLLIQRLTKLELEKQKTQNTETAAPPLSQSARQPIAQIPSTTVRPLPVTVSTEPHARMAPQKSGRKMDGFVAIAFVLAAAVLVQPTLASLTTTAILEDNNIISTLPQSDHILLARVNFRARPEAAFSRDPQIVIYNPTNQTIDFTNWWLEDNSGRMYTFARQSPLDPKEKYDLAPNLVDGLQFAGDRIVLKNASGHIVDAISWGTDTSQLNPAIQGIGARIKIKRTHKQIDTNTATDWVRTDEQ